MNRAYERSYDMLNLAKKMFLEAKRVLRETDGNDIDFNIYDQDAEVNKYKKEVREDVFKHLTLVGSSQLNSGLVVISMVIYVDRIAEHAKNLVEAAMHHKQKLHGGKLEDDLKKIEAGIEEYFDKSIVAFENADEEAARKLLEESLWLYELASECGTTLIQEEDSSMNNQSAVALAMYVRSLKRIYEYLRSVLETMVVIPEEN